MEKINANRITCIDVDDTLIYWDKNEDLNRPTVSLRGERFEYNEKMLNNILNLSVRGFYIIVWSQAGHDWCEDVVKALGIEDKIGHVMTKPSFAYDDLPLEEWCKRIKP